MRRTHERSAASEHLVQGEPEATERELSEVEAAMRSGSPAQVKALLQAPVHEVRVDDGEAVQPVFKLPARTGTNTMVAARASSRVVGRRLSYSNFADLRKLLEQLRSPQP